MRGLGHHILDLMHCVRYRIPYERARIPYLRPHPALHSVHSYGDPVVSLYERAGSPYLKPRATSLGYHVHCVAFMWLLCAFLWWCKVAGSCTLVYPFSRIYQCHVPPLTSLSSVLLFLLVMLSFLLVGIFSLYFQLSFHSFSLIYRATSASLLKYWNWPHGNVQGWESLYCGRVDHFT